MAWMLILKIVRLNIIFRRIFANFFYIDYAKYYESLSNNAGAENMDEEMDENNTVYETVQTQDIITETFEESGGEEFEEDEDIPLVSGKARL